jgi:hypothetical protein
MATKLADTIKEALAKKHNNLVPGIKGKTNTKAQIKSQTTSNKPMKKAAGRGG